MRGGAFLNGKEGRVGFRKKVRKYLGLCLGRIAITGGDITRTSWLDGILDGHTIRLLKCLDNIQD